MTMRANNDWEQIILLSRYSKGLHFKMRKSETQNCLTSYTRSKNEGSD